MNDERFFELAMKAITRQCSHAERTELDALLARQPELQAEFERLQAEARVAEAALPLMSATEATAGELPAYARGRLQTKVRQTLGRPQTTKRVERERERSTLWAWRWVLGLVAATAVVTVVVLPLFRGAPEPIIQVAMLDVGGPSRNGDPNELELLRQTWQGAPIEQFNDTGTLRGWETDWPAGKSGVVAKVVYDRAAAEIRVQGRTKRGTFSETFTVETDLGSALARARDFIAEQVAR